MLKLITSGNAGMEKRGSRRRRGDPYGAQTTGTIGGYAALATDYSNPDGPRFQTHPLAWSDALSRRISPEKQIRQNKGFQSTTHKLPLCDGFPSLQRYTVQPWVEPEP